MTTWQENDLHAAQLELEKESTSLGIARYEKIREQRQEAETGPGRKLVMESIDATAAAIMAFVAEADTGKPGKRHAALKFIRHLNPHALAYLTSFTCVNALVADHRKAVPELPQELIKPRITVGIAALGRGHDLNKLIEFGQAVDALVGAEEKARRLNSGEAISRLAAASDISTKGLIRSDDELAAEQQDASAQEAMVRAAPNIASAMTQTP
ncbi:hypothetical protein ACNJRW_20420 [Stenotrophomonas maltophilia]